MRYQARLLECGQAHHDHHALVPNPHRDGLRITVRYQNRQPDEAGADDCGQIWDQSPRSRVTPGCRFPYNTAPRRLPALPGAGIGCRITLRRLVGGVHVVQDRALRRGAHRLGRAPVARAFDGDCFPTAKKPCRHGTIAGRDSNMQAFIVSIGVVALAEMGDKTQLLSLVLAMRYRKPVPIVLGVFAATLANHAVAGGIGSWLASVLDPSLLNWCIVASFILMAGWVLVPDKLSEGRVALPERRLGVFGTTVLAFSLAEMGDKTQVVTVALAARFHDLIGVVGGTTLGMMLADIPVIYFGHRF